MSKVREDYRTRTITTPEGITITFFNNKLHNWNGPAVKYNDGSRRKAEYYLYGIQKTEEEWKEMRRQREGIPFYKNQSMKSQLSDYRN